MTVPEEPVLESAIDSDLPTYSTAGRFKVQSRFSASPHPREAAPSRL